MFPSHHSSRGPVIREDAARAHLRAAGVSVALTIVDEVLDVVLDVRDFVTTLVEEAVNSTMTALKTTGVLGHRGFRE